MSYLQKKNNDVQVFNNPDFGQVRTIGNAEKPMFCLADVCRALELENHRNVKNRLDQKGVCIMDTLTDGGLQGMIFVNEPNLYRCVFQSRKENALLFQDWIFNEVLPTIRKNGGYGVTKMSDDEAIAFGYARALDKINNQRLQILKLKGRISEYKRNSEEYKERKKQMLLEERKTKCKSVFDFIDEINMVASATESTPFRDILAIYRDWCVKNGAGMVAERTLGRILSSMDFEKSRNNTGILYSVSIM